MLLRGRSNSVDTWGVCHGVCLCQQYISPLWAGSRFRDRKDVGANREKDTGTESKEGQRRDRKGCKKWQRRQNRRKRARKGTMCDRLKKKMRDSFSDWLMSQWISVKTANKQFKHTWRCGPRIATGETTLNKTLSLKFNKVLCWINK